MKFPNLWKKRPKLDLKRYAPPGYPLDRDLGLFWLSLTSAAAISAFRFILKVDECSRYVFRKGGVTRANYDPTLLRSPGAKMPNCVEFLPDIFYPYLIVIPVLLLIVLLRYLYFDQGGSKSIYLMRRLPDKWELPRRCLALPLVWAALALVISILVTTLCFTFYILNMPVDVLEPNQWAKIWSVIP